MIGWRILIVCVLSWLAPASREAWAGAGTPAQASQTAGTPAQEPDPHAGHAIPGQQRPADLPPLTDEDRLAAFPDVEGHAAHDARPNYLVLFDQLEWQSGGNRPFLSLDASGWFGGDLNRLWFRAEGDAEGRRVGESQAHVLFGRAIARWWDVVAGIRQDMQPGDDSTWAAVGIQGLAPYWFQLQATGYVGAQGRTHVRLETEYELLVSNRLILQPLLELEVYGKDIPEQNIRRGLSRSTVGLRLRYEIRREFAPYIGITWDRRATVMPDEHSSDGGARLALGLRAWF